MNRSRDGCSSGGPLRPCPSSKVICARTSGQSILGSCHEQPCFRACSGSPATGVLLVPPWATLPARRATRSPGLPRAYRHGDGGVPARPGRHGSRASTCERPRTSMLPELLRPFFRAAIAQPHSQSVKRGPRLSVYADRAAFSVFLPLVEGDFDQRHQTFGQGGVDGHNRRLPDGCLGVWCWGPLR